MKVSELIEALQQQDQNVEVWVEIEDSYPGNSMIMEITSVIGQDRRSHIPILLLRAEVD